MHLYIISSHTNQMLVKIGYSADLAARLKQLQTGNPFRLKVLHSFAFPDSKKAAACETLLHRLFADYQISGEWFRNTGGVKHFLSTLDQGVTPVQAIEIAMRSASEMALQHKRHRDRKQSSILRKFMTGEVLAAKESEALRKAIG